MRLGRRNGHTVAVGFGFASNAQLVAISNEVLATRADIAKLAVSNAAILAAIKSLGGLMSTTVSPALLALQNQVAANTTVTGSALTLIQGFNAQLAAAMASGDPPGALAALQAQLQQSDDSLAAAVAANTQPPPAPANPAP